MEAAELSFKSLNEFQLNDKPFQATRLVSYYKAKHISTEKEYAVKMFKAKASKSDEREANLQMSLSHANILMSYGYFKENGYLYVVCELFESITLLDFLKQKKDGLLGDKEIKRIADQLAEALDYLHTEKQPILHRDLTLTAICISPADLFVKISRLNCAVRISNRNGNATRDKSGNILYASPESIVLNSNTIKSDIWSFGCVLYKLCTLKHPFAGEETQFQDFTKVLRNIVRENYDPIPTNFSKEIREIIKACLEKTAELRPTANDIISILKRLAEVEINNLKNDSKEPDMMMEANSLSKLQSEETKPENDIPLNKGPELEPLNILDLIAAQQNKKKIEKKKPSKTADPSKRLSLGSTKEENKDKNEYDEEEEDKHQFYSRSEFDFDEKPLGKGSFGTVYKVYHKALGKYFALKQLNTQTADTETIILSNLDFPNVLKSYGYFVEERNLFVVLDLCEGTLETYLQKQTEPLSKEIMVSYFRQLCEGINYLHTGEITVIHKDLKSANIFVKDDAKTLKIGDFGLAKVKGPLDLSSRNLQGTMSYWAPELINTEQKQDPLTDIWALGCILYEICTLKHPFSKTNATFTSLMKKISEAEYEPFETELYGPTIKAIVDGCLKGNPAERLNSQKLLELLENIEN